MGTAMEKKSTSKPRALETSEEEERPEALDRSNDKQTAVLLNQWKQKMPFERNAWFWCMGNTRNPVKNRNK